MLAGVGTMANRKACILWAMLAAAGIGCSSGATSIPADAGVDGSSPPDGAVAQDGLAPDNAPADAAGVASDARAADAMTGAADGPGGDRPPAGDAPVAGPRELGSLDEPCFSPALTGRALVSLTRPEYRAVLTYTGDRAGMSTPITIRVVYERGRIVCTPPSAGGKGGAPATPARLSVDVRLDVVTDDDQFNERTTGSIEGWPGAPSVSLSGSVAAGDLKGRFGPGLPPVYESIRVQFSGDLAGAVGTGYIGVTGRRVGDPNAGIAKPVGTWK
jgi:hypothetical protein